MTASLGDEGLVGGIEGIGVGQRGSEPGCFSVAGQVLQVRQLGQGQRVLPVGWIVDAPRTSVRGFSFRCLGGARIG